jgi:hypothetical protein
MTHEAQLQQDTLPPIKIAGIKLPAVTEKNALSYFHDMLLLVKQHDEEGRIFRHSPERAREIADEVKAWGLEPTALCEFVEEFREDHADDLLAGLVRANFGQHLTPRAVG